MASEIRSNVTTIVSLSVYFKSESRYNYLVRECHLSVFCPGFQKGRVPSEKGTLAR